MDTLSWASPRQLRAPSAPSSPLWKRVPMLGRPLSFLLLALIAGCAATAADCGDQHIGFIVNRPTELTLGKIFPDDGPSQKVVDPVYLGGPVGTQVIFALVQRLDSPGGRSLEVMPGLYAATDAETVDSIIRTESNHARFVAGFVAWQPGELRLEIERGAWYVLSPDPALAPRKPEGLWEELVRRSRAAANSI